MSDPTVLHTFIQATLRPKTIMAALKAASDLVKEGGGLSQVKSMKFLRTNELISSHTKAACG